MLKETKKDLFISFWQLLRKRNLLLFCSCNKVMFHYVCLSRSLWLGYVFMSTHPDQVVTAVTFSSLATKWIRFSEREVRKNYCKYIDIFMGIFDKLIFMKETWFFRLWWQVAYSLCCPVRYFVKFILGTIVQGIVNLSFWNSVWKIFMILFWLPGW